MGSSLLAQTLFGKAAPAFGALALLSYGFLLWRRFGRRGRSRTGATGEVLPGERGTTFALVIFPIFLVGAAYRLYSGRPVTAELSPMVAAVVAGLASWGAFLVGWATGVVQLMLRDRAEMARVPSVNKLELRAALIIVVTLLVGVFLLWQHESLLGRASRRDESAPAMLAFWARSAVQKDLQLVRGLAANPHVPPGLLLEMALSEEVRWARPLPISLWDFAFGRLGAPRSIFGAMARNPVAPPTALLMLAGNPSPEVASGVAENPSASPEALVQLASHPDVSVLRSLAKDPRTPPEALLRLADSRDPEVRAAVARHPKATPEVQARLVGLPAEALTPGAPAPETSPGPP